MLTLEPVHWTIPGATYSGFIYAVGPNPAPITELVCPFQLILNLSWTPNRTSTFQNSCPSTHFLHCKPAILCVTPIQVLQWMHWLHWLLSLHCSWIGCICNVCLTCLIVLFIEAIMTLRLLFLILWRYPLLCVDVLQSNSECILIFHHWFNWCCYWLECR